MSAATQWCAASCISEARCWRCDHDNVWDAVVSCRHGDMLGAVTVGNSRSVFSVLSSSLTANELARSEVFSVHAGWSWAQQPFPTTINSSFSHIPSQTQTAQQQSSQFEGELKECERWNARTVKTQNSKFDNVHSKYSLFESPHHPALRISTIHSNF